jgi:hypothetical protein
MRMTSYDLESVALALVAEGKGILAADETIPTLTRRFDTLGIQSTEQSRRTYREMLFTSPGAAEFISGVIMYDETIRQKSSGGILRQGGHEVVAASPKSGINSSAFDDERPHRIPCLILGRDPSGRRHHYHRCARQPLEVGVR